MSAFLDFFRRVPKQPVAEPEIVLRSFDSVIECPACLGRTFKREYRRFFIYQLHFWVWILCGPEHLVWTCEACGWNTNTAVASAAESYAKLLRNRGDDGDQAAEKNRKPA